MTKTRDLHNGAPEIASILRHQIDEGTLEANERLPAERLLANTYKVARGTVRRALNILTIEGYVEIRAGSGTYVKPKKLDYTHSVIENASPLELIDARLALEPHICRLAVLNATQNDFRKADQLLSEMDASVSDPNTFSEADNAFHTLLVETTGNRLLIWIMSQINTVRNQEQWSRMRHLTLNETSIAKYNQQHREILNKLRTREPDQAGELMKKHLETARLSLNRVAST